MSDWEEVLKKYMSWIGMLGAVVFAIMFFFGVIEYFYNGLWDQISGTNFASLVALPGAAFTAFFVVLVLRTVAGPIEFSVFQLDFKGASGPTVMWVLCFLTITVALRMTWPLEYSAPARIAYSLTHGSVRRTNSQILITLGLLCTLVGAGFLVGSLPRDPRSAPQHGRPSDQATSQTMGRADREALKAKAGFALIGVGAIIQGVAVWIE